MLYLGPLFAETPISYRDVRPELGRQCDQAVESREGVLRAVAISNRRIALEEVNPKP